jgi:hypothetical protein
MSIFALDKKLKKRLWMGLIIYILLVVVIVIFRTTDMWPLEETEKQEEAVVAEEQQPSLFVEQCLIDLEGLTDLSLAGEIEDFMNNIDITITMLTPDESRILDSVAHDLTVYLVCKVATNKDLNYYKRVLSFVERSRFPKEAKEKMSTFFNKGYYSPTESFLKRLATEEECSNNLINECLQGDFVKGFSEAENWCNNLCSSIQEYSVNDEKFNEKIINFNEWERELEYMISQYSWRLAVAYRIGGKDIALQICDNVEDVFGERANCIERVEYFEYRTKRCEEIEQSMKLSLCQVKASLEGSTQN